MGKNKNEQEIICIFDEKEEYLETKIIKIFELYLERVFDGILN